MKSALGVLEIGRRGSPEVLHDPFKRGVIA